MIALPQIGQWIYLQPVVVTNGRGRETFKSRVADVTQETIAIEVPLDEETASPAGYVEGAEWIVWYVGADGTRVEFRTPVTGLRDENIRLWLLAKPGKDQITRLQRRHFVRVSAGFEIAVKLNDRVRQYHFLARTQDVSGGGMAFTCPARYMLREGDQLQVWLSLPTKAGAVTHARAEGEVVRVKVPEEEGEELWVSVKYTDISEWDRAKVIRACFERQLEMRRKGIVE